MSKAQMQILVSRSFSVTHFLDLYESIWNGKYLFVASSIATSSVSIMKFCTSGLIRERI